VTRAGVSMGRYSAETMIQDLKMARVDWFRFRAGWGFGGTAGCQRPAGGGHAQEDERWEREQEPMMRIIYCAGRMPAV